jgi:hypothetical protein
VLKQFQMGFWIYVKVVGSDNQLDFKWLI